MSYRHMYIHVHLNSFAQVRSTYDGTKPVVSKYHTLADDIRPFANRARKYERIIKMSDTHYLIADVYSRTGVKYAHVGHSTSSMDITTIPFEWELRGGYEYLTVRNHSRKYATGRYAILDSLLPAPMRLAYHGKHKKITGIPNHPEGVLLPLVGDGKVTVRRATGGASDWELVGEPLPMPTSTSVLIDTDEKAKVKEELKALKKWILTMFPLVRIDPSHLNLPWQDRRVREREIVNTREVEVKTLLADILDFPLDAPDRSNMRLIGMHSWARNGLGINPKTMRLGLDETRASARMLLLSGFAGFVLDREETGLRWSGWDASKQYNDPFTDPAKVRSLLNTYLNKALGFEIKQ